MQAGDAAGAADKESCDHGRPGTPAPADPSRARPDRHRPARLAHQPHHPLPATRLPLPRQPADPPRPLPHLDPQSRPRSITKTLTPEDAERLRPYFSAHRRLRQLITELEAISIELAEQPARPKTPGDQPDQTGTSHLTGEPARNGQNTGRSAHLTREPHPASDPKPMVSEFCRWPTAAAALRDRATAAGRVPAVHRAASRRQPGDGAARPAAEPGLGE